MRPARGRRSCFGDARASLTATPRIPTLRTRKPMASAAERSPPTSTSAHRQGRRAQEADLVHPGRPDRLPARDLHPAARHRSRCAPPELRQRAGRRARPVQHVLRRCRRAQWRSSRSTSCRTSRRRSSCSCSPRWLPSLETLKKEGESGRKVLNQYTRYLTVVLAIFQAWGIAVGFAEFRRHRAGSGAVLPGLDRHHADRRHAVPDVDRRADHLARHRQRLSRSSSSRASSRTCPRRSPAPSSSGARARSRRW